MRATLRNFADLSREQIQSWDHLLEYSTTPASPFLSYAFSRAVHDARGGGRVLLIDANGGTVGFLPFQIRPGRRLLGHAEKIGGAMSDMFGIVGTIRSHLDAESLLGAANLSSLRFDHAVEELCPFTFGDRQEKWGIRIPVEDFSTFLDNLRQTDQQFVGMVAAGERRLAKKFGKIRFEWHNVDASAELDRIILIKRDQYRRTGKPDGLAQSWKQKLLHGLLKQNTSPLCLPVLSTLYAGNDWVASHFGLCCANTVHIWFPAYNPRFAQFGPGHMLLFKMFEHGIAAGFRSFDFGEGEATYKSRYKGQSYRLLKGVITARSMFGYAERVLQSLEWRVHGTFDKFRHRAAN
jgi:CelD/BcsL family acetyltransferase involved in cellulose biosynthesis